MTYFQKWPQSFINWLIILLGSDNEGTNDHDEITAQTIDVVNGQRRQSEFQ